jgi:hypothetical protein
LAKKARLEGALESIEAEQMEVDQTIESTA